MIPSGYDQIRRYYEFNPEIHMTSSGLPTREWEARMVPLMLPAPLRLSWSPTIEVRSLRFHSKVLSYFDAFYKECHKYGLWSALNPTGGAYTFRLKRTSGRLSMHAFGGAVDHDPDGNPQSEGIVTTHVPGEVRTWTMPDDVVKIARASGLRWGGDFDDPMHFQFGIGY